jgi:hypothetical protein
MHCQFVCLARFRFGNRATCYIHDDTNRCVLYKVGTGAGALHISLTAFYVHDSDYIPMGMSVQKGQLYLNELNETLQSLY